MTKLVLFAASIALAAPALAAPEAATTPIHFERDGVAYVGTMSERDGVRYLSGREIHGTRTFELQVSNGWVTGYYGGDSVAYAEPVRLITAR